MSRIIFFVASIICGAALAAGEPTPKDFAFAMPIVIEGNEAAYQLDVPLAVYQKAVRNNLADVRVFNGSGEVVPHALRSDAGAAVTQQVTQLPLPYFPLHNESVQETDALKLRIQSGNTVVDLTKSGKPETKEKIIGYVLDTSKLEKPLSGLNFSWLDTSEDFSVHVSLETSDDLSNWRTLSSSVPLVNLQFNGNKLLRNDAEFAPTKAKYWRIKSQGADKLPTLSSFNGKTSSSSSVVRERQKLNVDGEAVADKPGEYVFDLQARVPVYEMNLQLPQNNTAVATQLFTRNDPKDSWQSVGARVFYRLQSNGQEISNADSAINVPAARYWLARVDQKGGGLGKGLPKMSVSWLPQRLVFVARGQGPFQLAYGSNTVSEGEAQLQNLLPGYASLQNEDGSLKLKFAKLDAAITVGGGAKPAEPLPVKKYSLWAALMLGVGVLGFMAYRLMGQMGPAPGDAAEKKDVA